MSEMRKMAQSATTTSILETIQPLECKGKLKFYWQNCFTYVQVSDDFTNNPLKVLGPLGYHTVPLMNKEDSPRTHISVMTATERNRITRRRLRDVANKWRYKDVPFKVVGVESWFHQVQKTGDTKWLYVLKIESPQINEIRGSLGLQPSSTYYNMHMTICEKPV